MVLTSSNGDREMFVASSPIPNGRANKDVACLGTPAEMWRDEGAYGSLFLGVGC